MPVVIITTIRRIPFEVEFYFVNTDRKDVKLEQIPLAELRHLGFTDQLSKLLYV